MYDFVSFPLLNRYGCYKGTLDRIESAEGSLGDFSRGYEWYGINVTGDGGIIAREWAPAAEGLYLWGDFSE